MLTVIRAAIGRRLANSNGRNMSSRAFKIDKSKFPTINEDEIEEKFIGGSGPGGQSVNKSVNCCQLTHKPTGIVIKTHQSRSLEENRKLAREILARRLDNLYNGDDSVESQKKRHALHNIAVRESLSEKRRQMKKQYSQMIESEKALDK